MILASGAVGIGTAGTSIANLYKLRSRPASGTLTIPACTTKFLSCETNSTTTQATGDLTITEELEVSGSHTFDANSNTISVKNVDVNGTGTLNLTNSTLSWHTGNSDVWTMDQTTTLTTGNTYTDFYNSV